MRHPYCFRGTERYTLVLFSAYKPLDILFMAQERAKNWIPVYNRLINGGEAASFIGDLVFLVEEHP